MPLLRKPVWSGDSLPSQAGRRFVVTGATGGLGLEMTRALAAAGAHVVLGVRNVEAGREAAERVRRTGASGSLEVRRIDLSDIASVGAFAAGIREVDVLINNAGVMAIPQARSIDGFEMQLATNHLGPFALTNLLLPRLGDRVVMVGSAAHWQGRLDPADLHLERGYRPYAGYAQSKQANLLFMGELQRRLEAVGSTLRSVGGHPGYAATGITGGTGSKAFTSLGRAGNALVGQRPWRGALPILYAATADVPGDSYFGPHGPGGFFGLPAPAPRSRRASDPEVARALWEASEAMTGVEFPLVSR
ncbi:oxidoreductase [Nocardioides sp. AE5]|uniref:oxidoreductase n=1 Tax=Nocardioides sp. AE5 TaxID=2962573 RepID=UPI0028816AED|nr:oxidoreductase [Nocardioides sp. AE5]MDT0201449.1 oxidoreductase [Nocardioides sp. AE5]